ncbi:hypothetical protein LINGRAHAP2_LOCUS13425, partial [Linum grandiflorum]
MLSSGKIEIASAANLRIDLNCEIGLTTWETFKSVSRTTVWSALLADCRTTYTWRRGQVVGEARISGGIANSVTCAPISDQLSIA